MSPTICIGQSFTFTGIGEQNATLTWAGAGIPSTTGQSLVVTFTAVGASSYTLTQTVNGCISLPATTAALVINCNQPPIVQPDFNFVLVGTPVNGNVLTNDKDPEGGALTAFIVGITPIGLTLSSDGSYTYTAPTGTTAPVTALVQVCDGTTPSACVTTTLTLIPVPTGTTANNAPIANPDAPRTTANVPVTVNVLANDVDPERQPLSSPSIVSGPTHGTAIVNLNGTVSYTPAAGFTGVDQLTYRICDAGTPPACATATVTFSVDPTPPAGTTNTVPVAQDDALITTRNTSETGTVAANDRDPEGQTLVFTKLSGPVSGTVAFSPQGSYTYTPSASFTGITSFTYQVCDNATPALCAIATVYITVLPVPATAPNLTVISPVSTTTNTTPAIVGVTDPNTPIVVVGLGNTTLCSSVATLAGNFSCTVNVPQGPNTLTIIAGVGSNTTAQPITFTATAPAPVTLCDPISLTNVSVIATVASITAGQATSFSLNGANSAYTVTWFMTPTAGISPVSSGTGTGTGSLTFANAGNYTAWFKLTNASMPSGCLIPGEALVSGQLRVEPAGPNPCTMPGAISVTSSAGSNAITVGQSATFTMAGGTPNNSVSWNVFPTTGVSPVSGTGTIASVLFSQRGSYVITFIASNSSTPAGCSGVSQSGNVPIFVRETMSAGTPCDAPGLITIASSATSAQVGNSLTFVASGGSPGQMVWSISPAGAVSPSSGTGTVAVSNFMGSGDFTITFVSTNGSAPVSCVQPQATASSFSLRVQPVAYSLKLKVLLQGALLDLNSPSSFMSDGLMRDDLRSRGFIPTSEPYSALSGSRYTHYNGGGGETMPASVSAITGPNAVVDWVFVELRDPSNNTLVVATKSALVQRDGDVVSSTDGSSPLTFTTLTGNSYYVSIKHRNHLGVMTASAIPMSGTGTVVDFTTMTNSNLWNSSSEYDGYEMVDVGGGKKALWTGNARNDERENIPPSKDRVKYQGANNDLMKVFGEVMNVNLNAGQLYNFDLGFGYSLGDMNMDGKVKYQGKFSDSQIIFINVVDKYPLNQGKIYNYDLFLEQLP